MDDQKEIVYVDLDGVLAAFPQSIDEIHPSIRRECQRWQESNDRWHWSDFHGIFATLTPMPGAVNAAERLLKKYDVYLLSTAPWDNISAWSDKRRWVSEHLPAGLRRRLILTHEKSLPRGRFLIDDRDKHGAKEFGQYPGQEWIHFGGDKFPDWDSVLAYLQC